MPPSFLSPKGNLYSTNIETNLNQYKVNSYSRSGWPYKPGGLKGGAPGPKKKKINTRTDTLLSLALSKKEKDQEENIPIEVSSEVRV